jgi:RNA polymerase sigma-70 factor, ECF subfamily
MPVERDTAIRVFVHERNRLSAYIWLIVRDDQIVEDVLQEVALLLVAKHREIRDEAHLAGWLRKACRFKALEASRTRKSTPVLLSHDVLDLLEKDWGRLDAQPEGLLVEALQTCLEKLSPQSRQMIELRYNQNIKPSVISREMAKKIETVYMGLMRIHATLAHCVETRLAAEGKSHG